MEEWVTSTSLGWIDLDGSSWCGMASLWFLIGLAIALLYSSTSFSLSIDITLTCSLALLMVLLDKVPDIVHSWRIEASYPIWVSKFFIDAKWFLSIRLLLCLHILVFCIFWSIFYTMINSISSIELFFSGFLV